MKLIKISMGCLSSRSTVSPADKDDSANANGIKKTENDINEDNSSTKTRATNKSLESRQESESNSTSLDRTKSKPPDKQAKMSALRDSSQSKNSLSFDANDADGDDVISLLMENEDDESGSQKQRFNKRRRKPDEVILDGEIRTDNENEEGATKLPNEQPAYLVSEGAKLNEKNKLMAPSDENMVTVQQKINQMGEDGEVNSMDEIDMDLLRQYVIIDYEITQLEESGSLQTYHEKIDQLEQLERELDILNSEIDGMSGADLGTEALDPEGVARSSSRREDLNSLHSSSQAANRTPNNNKNKYGNNNSFRQSAGTSTASNNKGGGRGSGLWALEKHYERKVILQRERDRIKKDVEGIIRECDKLQQRCKERDSILDKLFDGRSGNGLENHLEQQLNWLLEQKHYVDQVFYAWKRAETLTTQTCEQFARANESLKRLSEITDPNERVELAKNISDLLQKSRQDMEEAQRYNPNVDAPFFTDNETRKFDKVIETITTTNISESEQTQIMTVIQFAYKRAVSIKFWLEQILEKTIARDSFELAEEYKWIAIQLRKERINLIKTKLQDEPYATMTKQLIKALTEGASINQLLMIGTSQLLSGADISQLIRNSSESSSTKGGMTLANGKRPMAITQGSENTDYYDNRNQNNNNQAGIPAINRSSVTNNGRRNTTTNNNNNNSGKSKTNNSNNVELNRDSGIYSDGNDMDIEEEIYRILEMNKGRYASDFEQTQRDSIINDRIEGRVKQGGITSLNSKYPLQLSNPMDQPMSNTDLSNGITTASSTQLMPVTPTKLVVELDEKTRQNLLKNVNEAHSIHKDRLEKMRGMNRSKVANSIMDKVEARRRVPGPDITIQRANNGIMQTTRDNSRLA